MTIDELQMALLVRGKTLSSADCRTLYAALALAKALDRLDHAGEIAHPSILNAICDFRAALTGAKP